MKRGGVNIGDISTVGCVECQEDFSVDFIHDVINVPRCPRCGTVVEGFENEVDRAQNSAEACRVLDDIRRRLEEILRTIEQRNELPEGISLSVLRQITADLNGVSQYAAKKKHRIE